MSTPQLRSRLRPRHSILCGPPLIRLPIPAALAFATLILLAPAPFAPAADAGFAIHDRGQHHRTWKSSVIQLENGRLRTNVSSFVELGSGINRWNSQNSQWVEADNSIDILPDGSGAVSHRGAHQVAFAANLNTRGAITLHTPVGPDQAVANRLVSHVLGLAWVDASTGRSEMFAAVQDSIGELHGRDTVIYRNAFLGVQADVVYRNKLGSFSQEVTLYENPPLPEWAAQADPEHLRMEVWTEFIEAPVPHITQHGRAGMTDDTVDFGMQTGPGRAFLLGQEQRASGATVSKRWITTADQRTCLVEAVRYRSVQRDLDRLPRRQAAAKPAGAPASGPGQLASNRGFSADRPFPPPPQSRTWNANDKFRTAASSSPLHGERADVRGDLVRAKYPAGKTATAPATAAVRGAGFTIDYELLNSITGLTLRGDSTYVCSNTVNLSSTIVWEGGCVVKFAPTNTAQINVNGTNIWLTGQYKPAILTAVDDHSVGTQIGNGTLSGYYGGAYLNLSVAGAVEHVRLSHANTGIQINYLSLTNRHMQYVHCATAVHVADGPWSVWFVLENVLFYDIGCIRDFPAFVTANHVTVHQCGLFLGGESSSSGAINNSLITNLEEWGSLNPTLNNSYQGTSSGIFQTVGAAAHYLANGSPHRNAANPALNSTALNNDLKTRTTYPPVVLWTGTWFTNNLNLSPQAQRDTDTLDSGYHYDPIDFVLNGVPLTNAVLSASAGTALAIGNDHSQSYGLAVLGGASFICEGSPTNLNRIVRYNTVQEQANTNWTGRVPGIMTSWMSGAAPITVRCRFVEWSVPAQDVSHLYGEYGADATLSLRDCQFIGGRISSVRPKISMTNSLLHRVAMVLSDNDGDYSSGHAFQNNLHYGGALTLRHDAADDWTFRDNLFADTSNTNLSSGPIIADYNGYTTNVTRLNTSATHDVLLATNAIAFELGALGRFYLPTSGLATNLLNHGSTNAHLLGLWHFTDLTNQVKETNTIVDIGFHYVAVGSNGLPVDTDVDGLPDYLEDADGDGTFDTGETGWLTQTDSDGDDVIDFLEVLLGRNPLLAGTTNDATGLLNLRRYTPLK